MDLYTPQIQKSNELRENLFQELEHGGYVGMLKFGNLSQFLGTLSYRERILLKLLIENRYQTQDLDNPFVIELEKKHIRVCEYLQGGLDHNGIYKGAKPLQDFESLPIPQQVIDLLNSKGVFSPYSAEDCEAIWKLLFKLRKGCKFVTIKEDPPVLSIIKIFLDKKLELVKINKYIYITDKGRKFTYTQERILELREYGLLPNFIQESFSKADTHEEFTLLEFPGLSFNLEEISELIFQSIIELFPGFISEQ